MKIKFLLHFLLTCLVIAGISGHLSSNVRQNKTINDGYGEYILIPAGKFLMGDSFNEGDPDEKPVHEVYLDAFYIGKFEVTNAEYNKFIDDNGYRQKKYWKAGKFKDFGSEPAFWKNNEYQGGGIAGNGNFPVVGVSWYEASAYCMWLSEKTGKKYRLPTEAEWEKAAAGDVSVNSEFGGQRKYPWGNEIKINHANFFASGDPFDNKPAPVGYYTGKKQDKYSTINNASPYGVYDMAGNVYEWCRDKYGEDYYSKSPEKNPMGPKKGKYRVIRGGGFFSSLLSIRCASRSTFAKPENRMNDIGFRCVREKE